MKKHARFAKKRRSYSRRRQSRWRRYPIRRKYNIRRRSFKYRVHYDKFVSKASFNPTLINQPIAFTVSTADWNNFGILKGQYEFYQLRSFKLTFIPKHDRAYYDSLDNKDLSLPVLYSRYVSKPPPTSVSLTNYADARRHVLGTNRKLTLVCKYPKYNWSDKAGNLFVASAKKRWFPVDTSIAFLGPCVESPHAIAGNYDVILTSYVSFRSIHYQANNTIKVLNHPPFTAENEKEKTSKQESILDVLTGGVTGSINVNKKR